VATGATSAAAAAARPVVGRGLERMWIDERSGADTIVLGDLTGSGVKEAVLQLGSRSGGDGAADTVSVSGTGAADSLATGGSASSPTLAGLPWTVAAANFEPGSDRLTLNGLGGADTLALTGSDGDDSIDVFGAGGLLHADLGEMAIESDDVESLRVSPLGGADAVTVNDLGGTDVGQLALDLASSPGGPADGQIDGVTVNARGGDDNVAIASGAAGISITGLAALHTIPAADPSDRLAVNGLAGADTLDASGLAANAAVLSLSGGPDADTLTGGPGADKFVSNVGDGAEVIEGGAGTDEAVVNGSDAAENISAAAAGARVMLTRAPDGGAIDINDVEAASLVPNGGADAVAVGNMAGTDLSQVEANLASGGGGGGGDGQADSVTVDGTNGADVIIVNAIPGAPHVTNLAASTTVTGAEPSADTLTVRALNDNDIIDAGSVPANLIGLVHDGGLGDDIFIGAPGGELFKGGDGDDVAFMGGGDDAFQWVPGDDNDTLEGQAGSDTLRFTGSAVGESIDISANGDRMRFFRNVANVLMDCHEVEIAEFKALGGADVVVVNDLTGTDVDRVTLGLAGPNGGGDAQADNVTVSGTNGIDLVSITGGVFGLNVNGLVATVGTANAEPADRLTFNALAGNDTVSAATVPPGAMALTLNGGAGDDTLTGGGGNDIINGNTENDTIRGGPGTDTLNGGGQAGDVVIQD
jgi:Ca2+-binding RTX toxin-like protein